MKRYYISKMVGDGTEDNPFRPKIADYGVNFSMQNSTGKDWALVIVSGSNHGPLVADPDITPLPDVSLDVKTSAVNKPTMDAFKSKMTTKWGIPTGFIDGTDGFRDVVKTLGQQHNPNFNENNFDVSE